MLCTWYFLRSAAAWCELWSLECSFTFFLLGNRGRNKRQKGRRTQRKSAIFECVENAMSYPWFTRFDRISGSHCHRMQFAAIRKFLIFIVTTNSKQKHTNIYDNSTSIGLQSWQNYLMFRLYLELNLKVYLLCTFPSILYNHDLTGYFSLFCSCFCLHLPFWYKQIRCKKRKRNRSEREWTQTESKCSIWHFSSISLAMCTSDEEHLYSDRIIFAVMAAKCVCYLEWKVIKCQWNYGYAL